MNKILTNQFRMHLNTQATLDENSQLWNVIPIFVRIKNDYDELIQRIEEVNEKTNPNSKAVTESKEKKLEVLIRKVLILAGNLQAYAGLNNYAELLGKTKLTKTEIMNARETDVEKLVQPVIDESRKHLTELADYMVTEDMITETETTLDDFKSLIGKPRTIRNRAFAAMTLMEELFDELNDLAKNKIDKLMIRFAESDPEFYNEYNRARTIVD